MLSYHRLYTNPPLTSTIAIYMLIIHQTHWDPVDEKRCCAGKQYLTLLLSWTSWNVFPNTPAAHLKWQTLCLLFSSKARNETNIDFLKSLEAWSVRLLSDIASQRSLRGPLIKEQVRLSISLTATRTEQRHTHATDYTCHNGLTWKGPLIQPSDNQEKMFSPDSHNTSSHTYQHSLRSKPLEDI